MATCVIGVPGGEEKEWDRKKIWKKKSNPNVMKDINP